jgi:predicted Zn-dependent protease
MIGTPRQGLDSALTFIGIVFAVSCATNPVSGKKELALVSESEEIAIGRQGASDVTATIGLYQDVGLQAYVWRVGQGVASKTERPALPWDYRIVDDASVNAFALPGGFIFVTRGLLAHMTNEAELASVLGHESGHVAARHSVEQMSRQQLASVGLGLGSVLSPAIARVGPAASAGLGLLFLKYSRDDETQADQLGFRYALADGKDARQMIDLFTMLQRDEQLSGAGRLPEWQATHPDPGNRIRNVQSLIAASKENFRTKTIGAEEFLTRIDGMVYGENPRAGYFRGNVFMHPDFKLLFQFPDGWKTQNASDAVSALSPAEDAVIDLRAVQGSAADAFRTFFGRATLQSGAPSEGVVHGNRTVSGEFTTQTDRGKSLHGIATFIEYGRGTWQITAYTETTRFTSYSAIFERSINSFDRLTDPAALAVQPMHLRIDKAPRAMSLQQFNTQLPSTISLAELALINGLAEDAQLRSGQSIKRVIGASLVRVSSRP